MGATFFRVNPPGYDTDYSWITLSIPKLLVSPGYQHLCFDKQINVSMKRDFRYLQRTNVKKLWQNAYLLLCLLKGN